ncbi:nucleoside triphosphate pyrophosphatase [Exiguobacterium sp.]|uniref:Maf family protein n=1 Tax=Exiguobacterium sp. TaxID=44751 RepID=UPI00263AC88D|nr:nucleoside triphosphate pyrophosphatase [Exiguobacterium sp.]MCC5892607.1 septum formation inhibitor Maf [Exiguobacterium sp.]
MKSTQKRVILASMSPRRTELLAKAGIHHEVIPSNVVEGVNGQEAPDDYVGRLAREKALDVARNNRDAIVIGSDTVVVLDGNILEKPSDREEARRMLEQLSGATHDVLTGVSILGPERQDLFVTATRVTFIDIPEAWLDGYLDSAEPYDKAGAYGIQGSGGLFVERLEGDYYNVVGLPLQPLVRTLEGHGVTPRFL